MPKMRREDLQRLLISVAIPIEEIVRRGNGTFKRDVIYKARDGNWMPRPATIAAMAEAMGVSVERVTSACEESCRRAGNADAIQRYWTGKRGPYQPRTPRRK